MVPNTSELLPEPETPVNTVSRRLGISTLMSLRLFTRAPCTRIMSWESAACSERVSVSVVAMGGHAIAHCGQVASQILLMNPGSAAIIVIRGRERSRMTVNVTSPVADPVR